MHLACNRIACNVVAANVDAVDVDVDEAGNNRHHFFFLLIFILFLKHNQSCEKVRECMAEHLSHSN